MLIILVLIQWLQATLTYRQVEIEIVTNPRRFRAIQYLTKIPIDYCCCYNKDLEAETKQCVRGVHGGAKSNQGGIVGNAAELPASEPWLVRLVPLQTTATYQSHQIEKIVLFTRHFCGVLCAVRFDQRFAFLG